MAIHNSEIAKVFEEMADLLEIQNENPFRVRAYRTAALVIGGLSRQMSDMVAAKEDLTTLPGIGEDLAKKIKMIVKTGTFPQLKALEKKVPPILSEMMRIEGLGPKRVKTLYEKLHIHSIKALEQALTAGKISKLPGFGSKTEERIKTGLAHLLSYGRRWRLDQIMSMVEALTLYLKKMAQVSEVICAGSVRRKKETIGDLDFLITAKNSLKVMKHFVHYDEVKEVLSFGATRSQIRLHSGLQVDLRVVPQKSYGAALIYFTGSKAHNIALRKIAIKHQLKMNEYGLFKGHRLVAGKTEEEVYHRLGLDYIPPELREDNGEIKAAKQHQLPKLITLGDIKGDLHCHTDASDGQDSLQDLVKAAAAKGYEYIAITDHSPRLAMIQGVDPKKLLQQIKLIDQLNAKSNKITILKAIEVDILENGDLDLPNNILRELDFTVCSIHSKFGLSLKKQTQRILRAMDNPFFTILGHPTGRLLNKRSAYSVDIEKILRKAKETGCFLEINAQPERLDLQEHHCKLAKELGVRMAISTDAHSVSQLDYMQYGVYQARRGWLEAKDVLNTNSLKDFRRAIKR